METINLKFDVKNKDLLLWRGQVVMSRSEEPYFDHLFSRLADLRPRNLLEIGFGLGISANLIQKYFSLQSHDIVEIEESVFQELVIFSRGYKTVTPIAGDWRELTFREKYDFVFYDPFDYFAAEGELNDHRRANALLLKELLTPTGILCHPHFGDGDVPDVHGFETVIIERLTVPQISMADGSSCTEVAIVYHRPITEIG